jgi:hypothetical protein
VRGRSSRNAESAIYAPADFEPLPRDQPRIRVTIRLPTRCCCQSDNARLQRAWLLTHRDEPSRTAAAAATAAAVAAAAAAAPSRSHSLARAALRETYFPRLTAKSVEKCRKGLADAVTSTRNRKALVERRGALSLGNRHICWPLTFDMRLPS